MARPYILIQQEILTEITELHSKGVPVSKLLRDYELSIASPTLQRLINYLSIANNSLTNDDNLSNPTRDRIYASLFPEWLDGIDQDEVSQPPEWYYKGTMPLGEWLQRNKKGKDQ